MTPASATHPYSGQIDPAHSDTSNNTCSVKSQNDKIQTHTAPKPRVNPSTLTRNERYSFDQIMPIGTLMTENGDPCHSFMDKLTNSTTVHLNFDKSLDTCELDMSKLDNKTLKSFLNARPIKYDDRTQMHILVAEGKIAFLQSIENRFDAHAKPNPQGKIWPHAIHRHYTHTVLDTAYQQFTILYKNGQNTDTMLEIILLLKQMGFQVNSEQHPSQYRELDNHLERYAQFSREIKQGALHQFLATRP